MQNLHALFIYGIYKWNKLEIRTQVCAASALPRRLDQKLASRHLFSRSAEPSEFLVESEAPNAESIEVRTAESLSDVAQTNANLG